jgi:hypothetical protein
MAPHAGHAGADGGSASLLLLCTTITQCISVRIYDILWLEGNTAWPFKPDLAVDAVFALCHAPSPHRCPPDREPLLQQGSSGSGAARWRAATHNALAVKRLAGMVHAAGVLPGHDVKRDDGEYAHM